VTRIVLGPMQRFWKYFRRKIWQKMAHFH
jgi:hypothetical protein